MLPTPGAYALPVTGWTFAQAWETVADTLPDAPAAFHGDLERSWAETDARADSLARFLLDRGCRHQDKVAFYLYNSPEYLELFFACSKASLVHVNTNYRYGEGELLYLWDNADAVVVVFDGRFTATIEALRDEVPGAHTWLWVDDDTGPCPPWATPYEEAAATPVDERPVRPPEGISGDDLVLLYTGGTTGMPKGVMWRQDDLFHVTDRTNKLPAPRQPDLDENGHSVTLRTRLGGPGPVGLPACPLMHGTGLFNSVTVWALGGAIATMTSTRFDVEEFLDLIERRKVKSTFIVGDAFAKPILAALDAEPDRWDLSSLRVILSSGVMWSAESKEGLLRHHDRLILVDTFGSSEAVGMGSSVSTAGAASRTATFRLGAGAVVISEDGRVLEPGSEEIGKVAIQGSTPIGYYKDPEKSAATFPVIDGVRYSVPGDFATIESDGTINLLGRGSVCINTGGEKVFPEEVEEVLKTHGAVHDAVTVGIPHERFGQAVTAVVEADVTFDEAAVIDFVKERLAHYKAPRHVLVVDSLDRAANGKVDYQRWAAHAADQLA